MLNKKELELLKQTGVNDKEVTEKLVNFLRHEFDNVVRVEKKDYDKEIVKLIDNKQGSYTFIDNESGDFLFKISLFNKEVDGENIGLSFIALNKQGWLLTKDDIAGIDEYTTATLLDENNSAFGINLAQQLVYTLDAQTIATQEWVKQFGIPVYKPTGEENAQEYFSDKQAPFFLILPNVEETLLIVEDTSDLYGYAFKGYDSDKKYLSHITIAVDDPDYTIDDLEIYEDEQEYFALLNGANFTGAITAPSIIENMSGYSWTPETIEGLNLDFIYCGAVKTGNKITFVCFFTVIKDASYSSTDYKTIGRFSIPKVVGDKIYPNDLGGGNSLVAYGSLSLFYSNGVTKIDALYNINKYSATSISPLITGINSMTVGTKYYGRIEATFLLSNNLASEE